MLATVQGTASGLAARYATALFALAEEAGVLERVGEDLARADAAIAGTAALRRILRDPTVSRGALVELMGELARGMGLHELVAKFLGLLAQKRRLFALPWIRERFEAMLMAHRGESRAEVVTALPLEEGQLRRLQEAIERHAGRRVRLDVRVDPELLGGLVVQIGSRRIDASLRTKLRNLELAMRGVG